MEKQIENNITDDRHLVAVPLSVLKGLYKIMSGLPYSMGECANEVHETSIPNMKAAQRWVLDYGQENKFENR